MASLPPKIDQRTYEQIVRQIEALAEDFTTQEKGGWKPPGAIEIEPKSELLSGLILNENISITLEAREVLIARNTFIDATLAQQIRQIEGLQQVKVKVPPPRVIEVERKYWIDQILAEDINSIKSGTVIDEDIAQKIEDQGRSKVKVKVENDAGQALIKIFARMVKSVSDRLNQVPEKNFLAFLDLIGGQLKPPQPAKVPLTFYLAAGSSVDSLVPAHTQVSAPPAEDSEEEIIFETDRELVVTTAQLQAVFVREPSQDKYSDCTLTATGQQDTAFLAFSGDRAIEHSLYISCPEIFALPELKNFHFHLIITDTNNQFQNLELNWSYWDGLQWQLLTNSPTYENNQFTFTNLTILNDSEIEGKTAKWLRAKLTNIDSNISVNSPQITNIKGSINIAQSNLIPEVCLFNNTPLDLSKDFYPFGEQPQVNDTFYIALHDSFIKPNATITIDIKLTHIPVEINNLQITWEIGNGQEWQAIADNNNELRWLESPSAIQFTESDSIQEKLQFPERGNIPSPSTVNGETRYWIRARITQGHYGKAGYERKYFSYDNAAIFLGHPETEDTQTITVDTQTIIVDNLSLFTKGDIILLLPNDRQSEEHEITGINSDKKELTLKNKIGSEQLASGTRIMRKSIITETISPTYDPPLVKSLKLTYNFVLEEDAIYCAENDFNYSYPSDDFRPFTPTIDEEPTLYLGFDKSFDNKTVTLYAQVKPPLPDELATDITTETFLTKAANEGQTTVELSDVTGWHSGDAIEIQNPSNKKKYDSYTIRDINDNQITLNQPLEQKNYSQETPVIYPRWPELVWEYSSALGWQTLGVQDETEAFSQSGLIQFIAPADLSTRETFGQELYWLRVRWQGGNFRVLPRLRRILTNTMWAVQAITLKEEVLGSSNSDPNQVFLANNTPILLGQQLEVQEGEIPLELASDRVTIIQDELGEIESVWVLWQEVADFYGSGESEPLYFGSTNRRDSLWGWHRRDDSPQRTE